MHFEESIGTDYPNPDEYIFASYCSMNGAWSLQETLLSGASIVKLFCCVYVDED